LFLHTVSIINLLAYSGSRNWQPPQPHPSKQQKQMRLGTPLLNNGFPVSRLLQGFLIIYGRFLIACILIKLTSKFRHLYLVLWNLPSDFLLLLARHYKKRVPTVITNNRSLSLKRYYRSLRRKKFKRSKHYQNIWKKK
jgi:hypothetical protein